MPTVSMSSMNDDDSTNCCALVAQFNWFIDRGMRAPLNRSKAFVLER